MVALGEIELKDAARQAAGNWQDFNCFVWFRRSELAKPKDWAVIYTHNRDSGLLDQSNASVIRAALKPFTEGDDPDVVVESHSHWAVGHVSGFSVRVFRRGQITKAFRTYHELAESMEDYPILDETDYSNRESEATFENLEHAAWRLKREFDLPENWQDETYSWLSDSRPNSLENTDDQGGWPDDDDLTAAFEALGYERVE
ncbi:hypothetical protein ETAA8_08860 [Anatilimnocola aggregata]|uniref:Uncharacterized protein n=1 Tax=Anatilimnocola aggregata TaxID=2528021 RepID=A0A517Y6E6_9BACT|nr:hypothetical protein [Anatilimnocola aggregata]QDU25814.1 hypothetical protein ETAA8_08860 [Anatilimnocola aggregata]